MEEKFLTTEQVAKILQVHPFTILKFIKEGKIAGIKLGRVYRIPESEVKRFIEERTTFPQKSTKQKKSDILPPSEKKNEGEDDHYYIV